MAHCCPAAEIAPVALEDEQARTARTYRHLQTGIIVGLAAILVALYFLSSSFKSEINEATSILSHGDVDGLRDYIKGFGFWAPFASLALMILQAIAAPVPGFLIVFANGLAFGVVWGGLLSLAGQTLAAVVCFLIARSLGRGAIEGLIGKFGLSSADKWFERWGATGIFIARLLPGIGFDAVSYAAGLTRMSFGKFVLATFLGAAPQTFLYAYLGQNATKYVWPLLGISTAVLIALAAFAYLRSRRSANETAPA
jgi:uncharacterized membrane protein YdjX (TVP38/TMEM64 family)